MLAACEPENCLLLLKEIYLKARELSVRSKRLGQVDIQYQRIVERLVCEEFAVALHTTPDLMKNRLSAAMEIKQ